MHGGFQTEGTCEIHGAVHITGGGVIEKFDRVLRPSGYGAELNNLLEPCDAMKYCQELGMVADEEAYHVWNMGQGFAIITPDSEKVIEECSKFNIKARVAGKIIEDKKILIKSRGVFSTGGVLEFKIG
jgi:phosphoribosylformylglycinamidine cyclo-ligase